MHYKKEIFFDKLLSNTSYVFLSPPVKRNFKQAACVHCSAQCDDILAKQDELDVQISTRKQF